MRQLVPGIAVLLLVAGSAGQTTRPADAAWSLMVRRVAAAIAEGDAASLAGALAGDVVIRAIDGMESRPADALRLLARAARSKIVCSLAYEGLPERLATDLAEAMREAGLPAESGEQFVLADEAQARRANAVGARWLAETLGATPGAPVGVVVLTPDDRAAQETPNASGRLLFVLLRGEARTGARTVSVIAFGDPLPAGK